MRGTLVCGVVFSDGVLDWEGAYLPVGEDWSDGGPCLKRGYLVVGGGCLIEALTWWDTCIGVLSLSI